MSDIWHFIADDEVANFSTFIASLVTAISVLIMAVSFLKEREVARFEILRAIKEEETAIRRSINVSLVGPVGPIDELIIAITQEKELNAAKLFTIYGDNKYEDIRKVAAYYEFIGYMVRKRCVSFHDIDSLFSFPLEFWNRTCELRALVTHVEPAFWENIVFLHSKYYK